MTGGQFNNPIVDYLKVSDDALKNIREIINKSETTDGIRISLKTRGCSGMAYNIEYAKKDQNITKFDDLVKIDDINIFIDPKASMFLIGSEMIYKENELESGFDFVNPNEKGRCGCGESFKV